MAGLQIRRTAISREQRGWGRWRADVQHYEALDDYEGTKQGLETKAGNRALGWRGQPLIIFDLEHLQLIGLESLGL